VLRIGICSTQQVGLRANGPPTADSRDCRRLAIAIFVTDSTADDLARDAVIARIAKAADDEIVQAQA
jgi:hypothetical protein